MKLAVIFIGTNQYLNFLPTWYESCEKYLAKNTKKTYFVFTDGELSGLPDNIIPYYQEHLSWFTSLCIDGRLFCGQRIS